MQKQNTSLKGLDYLVEILPTVNGNQPEVYLISPINTPAYLKFLWEGVNEGLQITHYAPVTVHSLSATSFDPLKVTLIEACKEFLSKQGLVEE